ncbi:phosphatidate cytidylyltransferase [Aedoeadaptatus coxii]|uniref:Phosphatidate cytidylyltransferase n=1 Tax=Aedoeadaptatus coxii TaxID=755172 RepID=A0A134ABP2_9FIRM|nr:phosphatidate cytidylyltransferase [Peptoniphilus coxii]KXB65088.1 phosphatidate cytidylyltransferase [Peptoniphilus coxii]
MNNFKKRTLTAVVLLIVLAGVLYMGGHVLRVAVLLFSLELCHELSGAFKHKEHHIPEHYILLSCFIHFAVFLLNWPAFLAFTISTFLLVLYYLKSSNFSLEEFGLCMLILIYVPSFFFPILNLDKTFYLYLVFIIAVSTDTFAYLTGMAFGKHKLCPSISPNKTIEGAVGAVVCTVTVGLIYCYYVGIPVDWMHALFIGIASVTAQLGDLFASKMKRATGIKDYGHILPGHGGFMDRFDSILMIIPMVYMLYRFPL